MDFRCRHNEGSVLCEFQELQNEGDRLADASATVSIGGTDRDTSMLPAQPNNSLITGLECLQHIVGAGSAIGSREVARRMGMTHTRVNRLLGTLAYMGLLEKDAGRRYRPGPGLHALAAQSMMASRLLPSALPVLSGLGRDGYTVALGTLWNGQVCYLFHERPGQSVEDAILRHELWPADHSTVGIAILAARADKDSPLPPPPENAQVTLLPGQDIARTVAAARSDGYATLRFEDDVISIGVAVGSPPIAGLAVSGRHLGAQFIPEIATRLHAAADEIERRMREIPA
jgi:DNA-binding IclR family transcriptional regulator